MSSLLLREVFIAVGARARRHKIALINGAAIFAKNRVGVMAARGMTWVLAGIAMATLIFADAFSGSWLNKGWTSAGLDVSTFCLEEELSCRSLYLELSFFIRLLIVLASAAFILWITEKGIRAAPGAMAVAGEKMETAGKRLAEEERAKEEARVLDDLLPRKSARRDAAKRL